MRIVHLTTVHPARDTRILVREAASLADHYDEVTLVANGSETFQYHDVNVVGLYDGAPASLRRLADRSRLFRPIVSQLLALRLLARLRPAVIHGHDPELLPLLVGLRSTGRRVVFDCHEDLGRQMAKKAYLGRWGPTVGRVLDRTLSVSSRLLSAVVVAHDWQYPNIRGRVVLRNLPNIDDLPQRNEQSADPSPLRMVYVGRIEENRGASAMLELLTELRANGTDATLTLVGDASQTLLDKLAEHPAWEWVDHRGPLPWPEAMAIVAGSDIGLFLPVRTPAYDLSESTKVYEYLALGLPAVVTDMEIYRKLAAQHPELALHVVSAEDPTWPTADVLDTARRSARDGVDAVRQRFTWDSEEAKLLELYRTFEG